MNILIYDADFFIVEGQSVIRLFGIRERDNSTVIIKVHGFYAFFYIREESSSYFTDEDRQLIVSEEKVKRMIFYDYSSVPENFIKTKIKNPYSIAEIRDRFRSKGQNLYDSNIPYLLQFMVEKNINGFCWIAIDSFETIWENEFKTNARNIASLPRKLDIPSLRIMSFDIECVSETFPQAEKDEIIQISTIIVESNNMSKPVYKSVFCLGESCDPVPNTIIRCFADEADLLLTWHKLVIDSDPHVLTGYNIKKFDLPYLLKRSNVLEIGHKFPYLSKIRGKSIFCQNVLRRISGRIIFDMYPIITNIYKLRSYKLDSVCKHFLNESKEDVKYTEIIKLQRGDGKDRARIATYCLQDSQLVVNLMAKLMILESNVQMARISGVLIDTLLNTGQQNKVLSLLLRAISDDYVLPFMEYKYKKPFDGGVVFEPERGFYFSPTAVLDFNSLYPSMVIRYNICYSTILKTDDTQYQGEILVSPTGDRFVKGKIGVLPNILKNLLEERKKVKEELKNEIDSFKKSLLDLRQNSIKLISNSIYGFTGSAFGILPHISISRSITAYGRKTIIDAKNFVETNFKEYKVIYGDTDSIMINFEGKSITEGEELSRQICKDINTNIFSPPVYLDYEKVFKRFLLMSKKRYAGITEFDKIESKGLENIRRDNVPLVSETIEQCFHLILEKDDIKGAFDYALSVCKKLLKGKVEFDKLIISKKLSKETYAKNTSHAEVNEKMKKRGRGALVGDRIPFVLIKNQLSQIYQKAEEAEYARDNNLALDYSCYHLNQLSKPLLRIFDCIEKIPRNLMLSDPFQPRLDFRATVPDSKKKKLYE